MVKFKKLWEVTLETGTRQYTDDVVADTYTDAAEMLKTYRKVNCQQDTIVKSVRYKTTVLVEVPDKG